VEVEAGLGFLGGGGLGHGFLSHHPVLAGIFILKTGISLMIMGNGVNFNQAGDKSFPSLDLVFRCLIIHRFHENKGG
jgi:hypothetical protein